MLSSWGPKELPAAVGSTILMGREATNAAAPSSRDDVSRHSRLLSNGAPTEVGISQQRYSNESAALKPLLRGPTEPKHNYLDSLRWPKQGHHMPVPALVSLFYLQARSMAGTNIKPPPTKKAAATIHLAGECEPTRGG